MCGSHVMLVTHGQRLLPTRPRHGVDALVWEEPCTMDECSSQVAVTIMCRTTLVSSAHSTRMCGHQMTMERCGMSSAQHQLIVHAVVTVSLHMA